MVSVRGQVPDPVLEGDVEGFILLADPPPRVLSKIRDASGDDRVRLMARAWFRQFHGSRNEAKRLFSILMREEGIPFRGDDIRTVTQDPPVDTQT